MKIVALWDQWEPVPGDPMDEYCQTHCEILDSSERDRIKELLIEGAKFYKCGEELLGEELLKT